MSDADSAMPVPSGHAPDLQLATSEFPAGLSVIEASAGTGKTYSISHLVPRLLLEGTLPDLPSLLLVTFTRDAARELGARVRGVLSRLAGEPAPDEPDRHPDLAALRLLLDPGKNPEAAAARGRLDRACSQLDLLSVSTIHSFCQRTLQQEGALCGLPVMPEVVTDDGELLQTLITDAWLRELGARPLAAALATSEGWTIGEARELALKIRGTHGGSMEPGTGSSTEIESGIQETCDTLADPNVHGSFFRELAKVEKWNKELDADTVLRRLEPFCEPRIQSVAFWDLARDAAELGGWISARGAKQKNAKESVLAHPFMEALSRLRADVEHLRWSLLAELAREALAATAFQLHRDRTLTQDGLVEALHHALHRTGEVGARQSARLADRLAKRYSVALIDESQDTDQRQLAIFRRIFLERDAPGRLILVGDPKQSIYGFRGADLPSYLETRGRAQRLYSLRRTFRSPAPLVRAVNRLFSQHRCLHHPELAFPEAESALEGDHRLHISGSPTSPLEIWRVPDERAEEFRPAGEREPLLSCLTAHTIARLLRNGELVRTDREGVETERRAVRAGDCAVLVSTHRQAARVADELERLGIASVINSGVDVFKTEEAADLRVVLAAVLQPRRTTRILRALATRLFGFTAADIAALRRPQEGAEPFEQWQQRFTGWLALWERRGLSALLHALDEPPEGEERPGIPERLAAIPLNGLRRVTNYRQVTDLLLQASREASPRPAELVRWFGQQIARADENTSEESRQLQLSADSATDARAVHVLTMHKAKGLEYPLVFCPFLADSLRSSGNFHSDRSRPSEPARLLLLPLLPPDEREQREMQRRSTELEERLRLAYVALTRAKVRVWTALYRSPARSDKGSPLDWLLRPAMEAGMHACYTNAWSDQVRRSGADRWNTALRERGAVEPGAPEALDTIAFTDPPEFLSSRTRQDDASEPPPVPELRDALTAPPVPAPWKVASFTGLTSEKHAHGAPVRAPRRPIEPATGHRIAFFSQPGSAAIGTAVHEWVQTWDFSPVEPDAEALLAHVGVSRLPQIEAPDTWPAVLAELFNDLRLIHLPGCGEAPLHTLCPQPHGSEWHFHVPLPRSGITGADLAECFERNAPDEHRLYGAHLRSLPGERLGGLLQGFIDRLIRQGPAWGLADWKTNFLGPSLDDYSTEALLACAIREHYLLQMHLYLVALRRYLQILPAPPPIAGAWLVFVRAIQPGTPRGVLHIDPPPALLDALERLLAPAQP